MRAVDPSVADGGAVMEDMCDPTPRHGFSTQCAQAPSKGCAVSDSPQPGAELALALGGIGAAVGALRRRRARGCAT